MTEDLKALARLRDLNTVGRSDILYLALQDIGAIFAGALQDLEKMKGWHSPSKRGRNYQHAMDSLEARLRTGEAAYQEVLQKMREPTDANT